MISTPQQEKYENPMAFNRRKGKRFEDVYRNRIPRNDRIDDIALKTTYFRLPLTLSFYLPVKGNLAFIFSGGTQLDLSVYQSIDFKSSYQGQQEFYKVADKPEPIVFNNLLYGMGLQYRFGRFVGQLTPYYNYQFRTPDYHNLPSKFGVNAAFKFDLRK